MKRRNSGRRQLCRLQVERLEDRQLLDAGAAGALPTDAPALGQILLRYRSEADPQVVQPDAGETFDQALARFRSDPNVLYAEPDMPIQVQGIPNDPSFYKQTGFNNVGNPGTVYDADIDAPEAWDITTGSTSNIVAVIDTGIDYRHLDLYRNIWINQSEIPSAIRARLIDTDGDGIITFWDLNDSRNQGTGKITDLNANGRIDGGDLLYISSQGGWANGISDDGDKYVDDIIGWNFVDNNNRPLDDNGHGSHVAGIIGATGNDGVGVAGLNWRVQMMPLKFARSNGAGAVSLALEALNYAVSHGAPISNNSWSFTGFSQAVYDAIAAARMQGHIFVVSAGNGGGDYKGDNIDQYPVYPAAYNLSNIVSVTAVSPSNNIGAFANYGPNNVDLGAPGLYVYSTSNNGGYTTFTGTSQAAPHVTGVLTLLRTIHPDWGYSRLIDQVMASTDPVNALKGKTVTGGRVNAYRALTEVHGDVIGPRVVSAVPNATGAKPVQRIRVTFSEGMDAASFTPSDVVSFTGPNGAIPITSVSLVPGSDSRQFDITFTEQSTPGNYSLTFGPDVRDYAGNRMDQNNNGAGGETADRYTAAFTILPILTFTSSTTVTIRDLSVTTATLVIDQDVTIADLNVRLNISHTFDNDLYIHLRGPDGTDVSLVNRRGGAGDNFNNTVLDDEAGQLLSQSAAPFNGSYRPETPLAAFDGKNARGTWTLIIEDKQAYDSGRLNSWSLIIEPT